MRILKSHWPLVLALMTLWGGVAYIYTDCLRQTQGHFVYPTDDTYIHMAMAKNLVEHGTWGVTAEGFSSSSSSPLWTILMAAAFFVFGRHELIPLFMNLVISTSLVWTLYLIIRHYCQWSWVTAVFLLLTILFTPMLPMVFLGMEHLFHAWLAVAFLYLIAGLLASENIDLHSSRSRFRWILLAAAAMTATRYEGAFLILVVFLLFLLRRWYLRAGAVMVAGAMPIVIYGIVSVMKGWYFFPNSILLKANKILTMSVLSWTWEAVKTLAACSADNKGSHLLVLFVAAGVLFIAGYHRTRTIWRTDAIMLLVFMAMVLFHVRYAAIGWFYRYEAYLVVIGCMAIMAAVSEFVKNRPQAPPGAMSLVPYVVTAILVTVMSAPLIERGLSSLDQTPHACKNIHDQQYQMGRFLSRFYERKLVALNDIGATCYLADINVVDLWGLANMETARAKRTRCYNKEFIERVCANVDIAIVYDSWYVLFGSLPSEWQLIGQWTIQDNVICGDKTVSFYALRAGTDGQLLRNLREFSPQLPCSIIESGRYTSAETGCSQ